METTIDNKELNLLIDRFMGLGKAEYKVSTTKDINGKFVKEGDIINADGYNSDIESDEPYLHVVEYDQGSSEFGSNIYGDFDRLSMYKKIEVIAHVEDFRHTIDSIEWSGNFFLSDGGVGKIDYRSNWDALMNVYNKINTIALDNIGEVYMVIKPFEVYVTTDDGHKDIVSTKVVTSVKDALFETIVKFVEFYNKETKSA